MKELKKKQRQEKLFVLQEHNECRKIFKNFSVKEKGGYKSL